ncbi:CidA/LrgA family protein [Celerinatantimonas diazotrophica]|uniref:Holin-like protein n=1 Tax=Celerinatantimonas diazotrophica TaxID=412034 RepID=A0A4R1JLV3_9GAMM|nr:CidA/LrgA family protein [Celerinatantimonas diazotrophica]TCK52023.1 holin-like protein [Celerinatantimonas diazotrophica]CAG9296274.1 Holin-like protein CidA [Celerinatantimonas diazotrophica]
MLRLRVVLLTCIQVTILSLIWMAANVFVQRLHVPVPSNLVGLCLLLILVFTRIIRPNWLRLGASWLLAEMLLFFVPAAISVIKYPQLIRQFGLQIMAVIFLSTLCVIISTAWTVDKMHRIEVRLARRRDHKLILSNRSNRS